MHRERILRLRAAGWRRRELSESDRIRTAESFSLTYGRVEVRAKLRIGECMWLWPAISWMLPTDNQYGKWPASGEIDHGVEGQPAQLQPWRIRCVRVHAALGPDTTQNRFATQNRFELTTQVKSGVNFTSDFHTFGLKWKSPHNLHRRRIKCCSLRQHIGAGLLGPRRLHWQRPLQSMEGQREQRSLRSPLLFGHQPSRPAQQGGPGGPWPTQLSGQPWAGWAMAHPTLRPGFFSCRSIATSSIKSAQSIDTRTRTHVRVLASFPGAWERG